MALFIVALSSYLSATSSTDWRHTLRVQVYPINGDNLPSTTNYIADLSSEDFAEIEVFIADEAERFKITGLEPAIVKLGPELPEQPPMPPENANPISIGLWSLNFRWWSYRITRNLDDANPDIKLFLVYYDPDKTPSLSHSVGLRKGLLGIVNVFADKQQAGSNRFVIAHEMMHTLGASDKYGGPENLPIHPDGYADPDRTPLYPQSDAEIMGGRIPKTATAASIPKSLKQVRVGSKTAQEIRWLD